MKTAIQNLYQNILDIPEVKNLPMDIIQKITEEFNFSHDEERMQIEAAFIHGNRLEFYDSTEQDACQKYYNETFKSFKS